MRLVSTAPLAVVATDFYVASTLVALDDRHPRGFSGLAHHHAVAFLLIVTFDASKLAATAATIAIVAIIVIS